MSGRWSGSDWRGLPDLQQNECMVTSAAPPIDQRLAGMAAQIRRLIPPAEVRLLAHAPAAKPGLIPTSIF